MKLYRCSRCGKIITVLNDTPVPVMCCGAKMEELIPGTSDGALEKHVPAVTAGEGTVHVQVGSVEHPMMEAHYIQFIVLETNLGAQIRYLKPGEKPVADFALAPGEECAAVYEYCNLHGLWKA